MGAGGARAGAEQSHGVEGRAEHPEAAPRWALPLLPTPYPSHISLPAPLTLSPPAASWLPPAPASHTQGLRLKHQEPNPCTDSMGQRCLLPLGAGTSPRQRCPMLECPWAPSQWRGPAGRGWVCCPCTASARAKPGKLMEPGRRPLVPRPLAPRGIAHRQSALFSLHFKALHRTQRPPACRTCCVGRQTPGR